MNGFAGGRLGIVGLGAIGRQIARRAGAFGMVIGDHNRRPREDAGEALYFDRMTALAEWADDLVVATPGGRGTRPIVDAAVLAALGAGGHVVNIARGRTWCTCPTIRATVECSIAYVEVWRLGRPLPTAP